MSNLPEGWADARLHDVCELINGRAYKQDELLDKGRYPVLRVGNFFSNRHWYYSDLDLDRDKYCDSGDLLYAWSASFGPRIWDGGKVIFHYHIWKTRPVDALIEKRFLYHWFEWDKENIKSDHGTGSTMIHVTKGDMEARRFALPPLPEQRRIVAKMDSLIGKSKRARDHLEHIPRLVEKYKQAIVAAAFRGNWPSIQVGEIIRAVVGGKNLRCEERPPLEHERGVVKVSAVSWGAFDAQASKTLPISFTPPENTRIGAGDLLISRANTLELVGAVVIVAEDPSNLFLSDKVLRLDVKDDDKPWLMWFLRSPDGRAAIEASATGNQLSMRNLSQSALRAIELPWPPAEERRQIVSKIETAFRWIDRLTTDATSARKLIDHLDQAVLAKAFKGELVPQDPSDEPASVPLERIRTERAAAPKGKRGRTKAA
ncbi:restriction endonuclease subunit S [Paraburkholderia edwinii]|uniref:Restriction endonuclease subunit S n=1 Tax=Paraburkholderia edwinii TaxID=2861782 RepID=A0ABX8UL34_9BURK|nr:restriction endonuclease subunit S [Paraburkholderia edwinii]QYD69052.1 restriction endonuclease subunit S [Paraburkholderia edwinii]